MLLLLLLPTKIMPPWLLPLLLLEFNRTGSDAPAYIDSYTGLVNRPWINAPIEKNYIIIRMNSVNRNWNWFYCCWACVMGLHTFETSWTNAGVSSNSPKYIGFVISTQSFRRACENGWRTLRFLFAIEMYWLNYIHFFDIFDNGMYLNR